MYLVKDLVEGRIVYYWVDEDGSTRSPLVATFALAEDWWKQFTFDRYEGPERRASVVDRRSNTEKRLRMDQSNRFASTNVQGRRETDRPVKVTFDLVQKRIKEMTGS
ncbi:hypothetical protein SAMN05421647_11013 [Marinobacterium stanieri]|uniref:Uncharacterized protein n=1 Tax=Marinobacterium stanieri TaxID=49186 RepID=A0A1N6W713_9GAMM|nr:hypothetical protein SAMN05421647_11013 [Marinobacterium stanieri]